MLHGGATDARTTSRMTRRRTVLASCDGRGRA
jgi:hypothetical protein